MPAFVRAPGCNLYAQVFSLDWVGSVVHVPTLVLILLWHPFYSDTSVYSDTTRLPFQGKVKFRHTAFRGYCAEIDGSVRATIKPAVPSLRSFVSCINDVVFRAICQAGNGNQRPPSGESGSGSGGMSMSGTSTHPYTPLIESKAHRSENLKLSLIRRASGLLTNRAICCWCAGPMGNTAMPAGLHRVDEKIGRAGAGREHDDRVKQRRAARRNRSRPRRKNARCRTPRPITRSFAGARQVLVVLDGHHLVRKQGEYRRRIARPGPHLEDAALLLEAQVADHLRHDDRVVALLPVADGDRPRACRRGRRKSGRKLFPVHVGHGVKDRLVRCRPLSGASGICSISFIRLFRSLYSKNLIR